MFDTTGVSTGVFPVNGAVVPVDLAFSPDGTIAAIVSAGSPSTQLPQLLLVDPSQAALDPATPCPASVGVGPVGQAFQTVAVAFLGPRRLVAQSREPAQLVFIDLDASASLAFVSLSSISREDSGLRVFHSNAGQNIACASCHPEGRDDGRVWNFNGLGQRRTPSLRGTIKDTAPYHWGGEMNDLPTLIRQVFMGRMGGPPLDEALQATLISWVEGLPALSAPPPADSAAVARGKALFQGDGLCSTCHSGAHFTNNQTVDVGTGGAFQVPPLIGVRWRARYLHDGCALTLHDRFSTDCGTHHGKTDLADAEVSDLIAYLETL
jgi:mono/diheme cytochrome c family protein